MANARAIEWVAGALCKPPPDRLGPLPTANTCTSNEYDMLVCLMVAIAQTVFPTPTSTWIIDDSSGESAVLDTMKIDPGWTHALLDHNSELRQALVLGVADAHCKNKARVLSASRLRLAYLKFGQVSECFANIPTLNEDGTITLPNSYGLSIRQLALARADPSAVDLMTLDDNISVRDIPRFLTTVVTDFCRSRTIGWGSPAGIARSGLACRGTSSRTNDIPVTHRADGALVPVLLTTEALGAVILPALMHPHVRGEVCHRVGCRSVVRGMCACRLRNYCSRVCQFLDFDEHHTQCVRCVTTTTGNA